MNINQKGFVNIVLIVIVVAVVAVSGYFAFVKKSELITQEPTPTPTTQDKTANWKTYPSPIHNFSFQYPLSQGFEISEDGGMGFTPGKFGSSLNSSSGSIFTVDVFYTPEFTTLGNIYGDVDALEKGFKTGGVEEIAKLSREVNLQKETNSPNKQVGEIESFHFYNGTGYGFTVTDTFKICFNIGYTCESGGVVDSPLTVVYVTNGQDIYVIKFPVGSLGDQILSTFKLTK